MSSNEKKPTSVEGEAPPKKARPWTDVIQWPEITVAIIAALGSMIGGIIAALSIQVISSRIAPRIPPLFMIILSVSVGVIIIARVAVNLSQRQARQRQLIIEKLVEKEGAFLASVERDISALLEEEVRY